MSYILNEDKSWEPVDYLAMSFTLLFGGTASLVGALAASEALGILAASAVAGGGALMLVALIAMLFCCR